MVFFNIPNILSCSRILIIPIQMVLIVQNLYLYAFWVFVFGTVTDFLDGYFARKLNQITPFGMVLDPIADKMFFLTTLIFFTYKNDLPLWFLYILIVREFFVVIGSVIIISKKCFSSISPNLAGKSVNIFLFLIIFFKFLNLLNIVSIGSLIFNTVYFVCITLSYISLLCYFLRIYKILKVKILIR